ncbi:MAG: tetratricopeptide repeat protein, partial [Treponema sp.]|nr:tetratricopeptide repeat protein [Treponema sp.]
MSNRGYENIMQKKYDQAIADLSQAIRLNPNDAAVYHKRGAAYARKGDCDRALADYNQAIKIDPNYALAYNDRGAAYARK